MRIFDYLYKYCILYKIRNLPPQALGPMASWMAAVAAVFVQVNLGLQSWPAILA